MSPRTGRPKVDEPKNIEVKVRFTEKTNQELLHYSKKRNLKRAEAIRIAVDLLLSQEK